MKRRAKEQPSVLPGLVAAVLLAAVSPAAAQARPHACLAPGGDDDTGSLQEALDRCSGAKRHCTVRLCEGGLPHGHPAGA